MLIPPWPQVAGCRASATGPGSFAPWPGTAAGAGTAGWAAAGPRTAPPARWAHAARSSAARGGLQAHAGAGDQEALDALARRTQRAIGVAEPVLVPEVHARLVLGFDGDGQIGEERAGPGLHGLLRLRGQVGRVEIEQVVVLDVRRGREARAQVPHGLEQATRHQPGIGQAQKRQALQNGRVVRVLERFAHEAAPQRRVVVR